MLKNWIVKTQQKKGKKLRKHLNYLVSKNSKVHKDTRIRVFKNSANKIFDEFDQVKKERAKLKKKGGGYSNYATSFIMSLPRDIKQPTDSEWAKIAKCAITAIAQASNLTHEQIAEHCHIVLHDESKTNSKSSHLHLIVGNCIDGKFRKEITQLKTTYNVKKSFNYSVRKYLKVSNKNYVPKNIGKNLPPWERKKELAEEIMSDFKRFKSSLTNWMFEMMNQRRSREVEELAEKTANFVDKIGDNEEKLQNIDNEQVPTVESMAMNEIVKSEKELNAKENEKISTRKRRRRRKR